MNEKRRCAFAVCGSFCTLETALEQAQELTARGWELLIGHLSSRQPTLNDVFLELTGTALRD